MDAEVVAPFLPTLLVIAGVAIVVGSVVTFYRWLGSLMSARITEAFSGKQEYDRARAVELADSLKSAFRDALTEHEGRERSYVDSLRDKIVEYHAMSLQAIEQARRLSVHVSAEYQELRAQISSLQRDVESLKAEVVALRSERR